VAFTFVTSQWCNLEPRQFQIDLALIHSHLVLPIWLLLVLLQQTTKHSLDISSLLLSNRPTTDKRTMPLSTSRSAVLLLLTTLVLIGIMAPSATAFQSPLVVTSRGVTYTHKSAPMRTTPLFESPDDPTDTPSEAVENVPVLAAQEEEASYPIDLPSPVLLGTSMILAIAATGR
jgi:hypothetical protein